MTPQTNEAPPKNCFTCAFQYPCNKNNGKYCTLKNFPILNPDIGCSRQMYKTEFKSNSKYITDEEKQAAKVAKEHNRFEI